MRIDSLVARIESRIAQIESRLEEKFPTPDPRSFGGAKRVGLLAPFQPMDGQIRSLTREVAAQFDLDPDLFERLVTAESGGNARAVSKAGAMGLTQLMPATAKSLGVTDPFDPQQNLQAGARYFKGLLERFGDPKLALAAYNAGPGAVKRYGGVPPFEETQAYVEKVLGE